MRGTYITATVIALLIVLWLLSGQMGADKDADPPTLADLNRQRDAHAQDTAPTRVRVRVVRAEPQVATVVLRGRTENKRTVEVKAETSGRIVERPVERGTEVQEGDLLCRISMEDRMAALDEARAALEEARIEYQGSLRLKEQGLQSETAIAQAKARLAAAEAQVARGELDLERTQVRAPFAGVVDDVHLDVGDYATTGASCVTIVDLNPMLLVGHVSEREVSRLQPGQPAAGRLSDGREVEGPITFVGHRADSTTRTYPVEVEVPNPEYELRSGITAQIRVPVDRIMAHKVSPALFALDDEGNIGVRTVSTDNRVEFHRVEIVHEEQGGVWVTGLPEAATIITVGQELVVAGQEVDPVFEPAAEMPARANEDGGAGDDGERPLTGALPASSDASTATSAVATRS